MGYSQLYDNGYVQYAGKIHTAIKKIYAWVYMFWLHIKDTIVSMQTDIALTSQVFIDKAMPKANREIRHINGSVGQHTAVIAQHTHINRTIAN